MRGARIVALGCVLLIGLGMIFAMGEFDTPGSEPFTCRAPVEAAWGSGVTGAANWAAHTPLDAGRRPAAANGACVGGARVRLAASVVLVGGAVTVLSVGHRRRKQPGVT